ERRIPSAGCDYRDYYANLRDKLLGKASLAVTPEWAINVMRLLEMARASSEKACTIPW
ncbi:MAG: oxidoreductase, partial [Acidobacteria bacterium Pan2503]|nr:oxidoreductase [Candidatus Acidoferrum panamensis]